MWQLVVWYLDLQPFALPFAAVEQVVRAVSITPLPDAPSPISGIINVQGKIVPVVDIRMRFGLPQRQLALTDHLIIVRARRHTLAFPVDSVQGVMDYQEDTVIPLGTIVPNPGCIAGAVKLPVGIILIHDLDRCLSLEQEEAIERLDIHVKDNNEVQY